VAGTVAELVTVGVEVWAASAIGAGVALLRLAV
jgi:hypothetical protein